MSVEFLRQIAATPLPKSFRSAKDMEAVKMLRQAGLVLALMDEPPERAARILAITAKGRDELLRFHYPDDPPTQPTARRHRFRVTALGAPKFYARGV